MLIKLVGLLVLLHALEVSAAGPADIYIVYAGKDKKTKSALVEALSADLSTKSYNVDLLSIADYSGKQKALSNLSKARVVVIVGDRPSEILQGETIKTKVIVIDSLKRDIKTNERIWNIVRGSTERPSGVAGLRTVLISAASELDQSSVLSNQDVLFIDGDALSTIEATAIAAERICRAD